MDTSAAETKTVKVNHALKVFHDAAKSSKEAMKTLRDGLKEQREEVEKRVKRHSCARSALETILSDMFPKKVKNALQIYMASVKAKAPAGTKPDAQFMKDCNAAWKQMTSDEKKEYQDLYQSALKEYREALAAVDLAAVINQLQQKIDNAPELRKLLGAVRDNLVAIVAKKAKKHKRETKESSAEAMDVDDDDDDGAEPAAAADPVAAEPAAPAKKKAKHSKKV